MQILTNQFQKELKKHGSDGFPLLISYESLSAYESGAFLWHWHPEIEITLIQGGQMCYQVNDRTYHLKQGDLLFVNTNVLHAGKTEQTQNGSRKDCTYISVTFDARLVYGFIQSAICVNYAQPLLHDFSLPAICMDGSQPWHSSFAGMTESLISLVQDQPSFYEIDAVIHLLNLWKLLLANIEKDDASLRRPSLRPAEYERLKQILAYIEQNYMHKITLKEIAQQVHLCESECCRLFKRHMNMTLFAYLQEYRVERSLDDLCRMKSISEAAGNAGFSDSNYYSKVFSRIKGCSPQMYRKNQKPPMPFA